MRLDKIISRSRIVDLRSSEMKGALEELLAASVTRFPDLKPEALLKGLLARESTMTTYLGEGVALPHFRMKMGRRYLLAIGRSRAGIRHDGPKDSDKVHLVLMLLVDERARDYLQLLASIARLVKEPALVRSLLDAPTTNDLYERLISGFGGLLARPVQAQQNRLNRLMLREADRVARGAGCAAVMIFGDTFITGIEPEAWFPKAKTILVTRNLVEPGEDPRGFADVIQVRSFSTQRMAQLRSAILVALTRGTIAFSDRVCCVDGITGSNQFDTAVVVVDVQREFQALLTGQSDLLPADVKPEVLERVVARRHRSLAVEGREGRPVGCLFAHRRHGPRGPADQAARPESVLWLQRGGPQHPQPVHGRDGEGVFHDRRRVRDPGRRGGGVGGQPDPGGRQRPRAAERAGQPARRRRRDQRRGRLHRARRLVEHRAGGPVPPRRDAAASRKSDVRPARHRQGTEKTEGLKG